MTNAPTLPDTLRAIRAALNLTQEELGGRIGVSVATVNRWEGGGRRPQKAARAAIAALAEEAGVDNGAGGEPVVPRKRNAPKHADWARWTRREPSGCATEGRKG